MEEWAANPPPAIINQELGDHPSSLLLMIYQLSLEFQGTIIQLYHFQCNLNDHIFFIVESKPSLETTENQLITTRKPFKS